MIFFSSGFSEPSNCFRVTIISDASASNPGEGEFKYPPCLPEAERTPLYRQPPPPPPLPFFLQNTDKMKRKNKTNPLLPSLKKKKKEEKKEKKNRKREKKKIPLRRMDGKKHNSSPLYINGTATASKLNAEVGQGRRNGQVEMIVFTPAVGGRERCVSHINSQPMVCWSRRQSCSTYRRQASSVGAGPPTIGSSIYITCPGWAVSPYRRIMVLGGVVFWWVF